eukprot:gene2974-8185_t
MCEQEKQRWFDYYARGVLPWDSGTPASQLREFVNKFFPDVAQRTKRPKAIELGCGTGASCVYLAQHGFDVTGVDLVPEAIDACRTKAIKAGVEDHCTFIVGDAFALPWEDQKHDMDLDSKTAKDGIETTFSKSNRAKTIESLTENSFDLIYDCQTFHVLRKVDEPGIIGIFHQLLKPGGYIVTLTGNDAEPERGPSVLSKDELLFAFTGATCVNHSIDSVPSAGSHTQTMLPSTCCAFEMQLDSDASSSSAVGSVNLHSDHHHEETLSSDVSAGAPSDRDNTLAPIATLAVVSPRTSPETLALVLSGTSSGTAEVASSSGTEVVVASSAGAAGAGSPVTSPLSSFPGENARSGAHARFGLVQLRAARFDPTSFYLAASPTPPLAWCAVFRKYPVS